MAMNEIIRVERPRTVSLVMLPDGTIRKPYNAMDGVFWDLTGQRLGWWRVAKTVLAPGVWIDTSFMGCDLCLDREKADEPGYAPTPFETMLFGGVGEDDEMTLWAKTRERAVRNHQVMVRWARIKMKTWERPPHPHHC